MSGLVVSDLQLREKPNSTLGRLSFMSRFMAKYSHNQCIDVFVDLLSVLGRHFQRSKFIFVV